MSAVWPALLAAAVAHGPAPSPLGVVAWEDSPACGLPDTPAIVRTNIGLGFHRGDGTYRYGCPSRWGDAEAALAAAPAGAEGVVVASTDAAWWVDRTGCDEAALPLPDGVVVLSMAAGDEAWLLVRGEDGETAVWRVGPDGRLVGPDPVPDARGLAVDGDRAVVGVPDGLVFLSADGDARDRRTAWSDGTPATVVPTALDGERVAGVWIDRDGARQPVAVDAAGVMSGLHDAPAAEAVVLGPVRRPDGFLVVVDGVRYGPDGSSDATGWTLLVPDRPVHGRLGALHASTGDQPRLFAMTQLGPPDPACPDPAGTCALDWGHFGGESGWLQTEPAVCPDGERTPVEVASDEPAGPGCGGERSSGLGALLALLAVRGRRGSGGSVPRRRPPSR